MEFISLPKLIIITYAHIYVNLIISKSYYVKLKRLPIPFINIMVYYHHICFATSVRKIALAVLYRFSNGMDSAIATGGT
jgi:hypothetical protein